MFLFLRHESPGLVALEQWDLQVVHALVVEPVAGGPDPGAEAHDRISVNIQQPGERADRQAFGQQGEALALLGERKLMHGAPLFLGRALCYA